MLLTYCIITLMTLTPTTASCSPSPGHYWWETGRPLLPCDFWPWALWLPRWWTLLTTPVPDPDRGGGYIYYWRRGYYWPSQPQALWWRAVTARATADNELLRHIVLPNSRVLLLCPHCEFQTITCRTFPAPQWRQPHYYGGMKTWRRIRYYYWILFQMVIPDWWRGYCCYYRRHWRKWTQLVYCGILFYCWPNCSTLALLIIDLQ